MLNLCSIICVIPLEIQIIYTAVYSQTNTILLAHHFKNSGFALAGKTSILSSWT